MFLFSFFEIPKGVRKRLDYYRSCFFWESDQTKRKYLTRWNIIRCPKDQGGLGIEVLDIKNKCLLSKWLLKFLNEEDMWQELLHNKYLSDKTLSQFQVKPIGSPFWKEIMHGWMSFFSDVIFIIGDGMRTCFWEDSWLGDTPLAIQYATLYNLVQYKNVKVADVVNQNPLNISFRCVLRVERWESWLDTVERLMEVHLLVDQDRFKWNLTTVILR
jgi:hypothetical protein